MLFACISDLHVRCGARWEEGRRVHRWIVDLIADRLPDGILIGGDFHDARTAPQERNEGAKLLVGLANISEVVGVYGNHDVPGDLDLYTQLATRNPVSFYARPTVHRMRNEGAVVACIPWEREAPAQAVLALSPAGRKAAEANDRQVLLDNLGAELEEAATVPGMVPLVKLVLSHVMLREARVGTGQPERRGKDFSLSLGDLARLRAHAYLLGHVHQAQEWSIDGSPVCYPGSTHRRTWGEIERKHVVFVHVAGGVSSVEYVEVPATPMVHVDLSWVMQNGVWGWSASIDGLIEEVEGADVRVRFESPVDQRGAASKAATSLTNQLVERGAATVKREEILIPQDRARAPEIATASSIEDKLAVALEARGVGRDDPRHDRVVALHRRLAQQAER